MKKYRSLLGLFLFLLIIPINSTSADTLSEEDQTIATADKLLNSTVKIDTTAFATGSGFFVDKNTIITNYHVIAKNNGTAKITLYSGKECKGKVGYRDEGNDLALVKVDCEGIPLTFAHNIKIGQSIISVGNPDGFDFSVSKGIVSAQRNGWLQVDSHIDFGSSGGVVADLQGEIVGVMQSKSRESDYIGNEITVQRVDIFLNDARGD